MARKTLKLIPAAKIDPTKMTILDFSEMPGDAPLIRGENPSGDEFLCGACGAVAVTGLFAGQMQGIVLHCRCGAYNDATI